MAHLWQRDQSPSTDAPWSPTAVEETQAYALGADGPRLIPAAAPHEVMHAEPRLLARDGAWFLVAPRASGVSVNGVPVATGLRALDDRDAIRVEGRTLFFSSERLARVDAYAGETIKCARCRQPIAAGVRAVACPSCGALHHEDEQLPCWTYEQAKTCARCNQPNGLDAGFRWTPDREEGADAELEGGGAP